MFNSHIKLNKEYPEIFEHKFKRKPKAWTIEMVHDLYLRSLDRHNKRQKLINDVVDKIAKNIQEFKKDKRTIYFIRNGKIYERNLYYHIEYDSWGIGCPDLVKFTNDKTSHSRNEKLEFILSKESQFELGELYESLQGNTKRLHWLIWEVLSGMVEEKLRDVLKGDKSQPISTISISDKKYYVVCGEQTIYNRFYKKFKLSNEVTEIVL